MKIAKLLRWASARGCGFISTMRVIVPLHGVVQGRGGVFWGSIIPCALFYFLQLYIRQRRPNPSGEADGERQNRASAQVTLSQRNSCHRAFLSSRASAVAETEDSPYYVGWQEYHKNPYHEEENPGGVIQLGLAENNLSLDLLEDWLRAHPDASSWTGSSFLPFKDMAPYQDSHGLRALKQVLASDFLGEVLGRGISFNADNIVLTAGATAGIEILAFCLAEAGDAFLVPSPYYPGFDRDIKWRSGVQLIPIPCPSSEGFAISRRGLEKAFAQSQRQGITVHGVLISSPGNPMGNVLDADTLRMLFDFASEKHLHIISDEVYAGSVYKGSFVSAAEIMASGDYDNNLIHIIYGLSKDMGIPGFRVGILYTMNKTLLAAAQKLTRFCTVSSHTQRLLTSLLSDKYFIRMFLKENKKRLGDRYKRTVARLLEVGIPCAESFAGLYCWLDMRTLLTSPTTDSEKLLWKGFLLDAKVNLTPGSACHNSEAGWFRLCFASVDEQTLDAGLERIREFVAKHRKP